MPQHKLTQEEFYNNLKALFPNEDFQVIDFNNYGEGKTPATVKCNSCGNTYTCNRARSFYQRKHICLRCCTSTRQRMLELLEKNNFDIVKEGKRNRDKVLIHCNKCGLEFERIPDSIAKTPTDTLYCPRCSDRKDHAFIDYQGRVNDIFGKGEYSLLEEAFDHKKTLIKHNKCGFIMRTKINNFLRSKGCPKCSQKTSKGERKILNYLENTDYSYQYHAPLQNSRQSFDFLVEGKIAIEYQGQQHYFPIECFGGEERFKQQQQFDNQKREYCKNNNITLLEISYKDFDNINSILDSFFSKFNDQSQDVAKD